MQILSYGKLKQKNIKLDFLSTNSNQINHTYTDNPFLPYLAFTAHLVALAKALLLGVAQGVPGHDVITQGHMHAPVGLGLACKRTRQR